MKVQWLTDFIDLLYPEVCCACSNPILKNEEIICIRCLADLPKTYYHLLPDNPTLQIFTGRCRFIKATSYLYFVKKGIVQNILHHLKYKDKPELGIKMGRLAGLDLDQDNFFKDIDLIVPIPLHPAKLKKRGYNQSEMLAQGLCEISGKKISTQHLLRINNNSSQTKKNRFERWLNVESIFTVTQKKELEGKHILLIDDVVTTGSTLESAVMKLEQIPGIKISLFTLAYAQ